MVTMGGCCNNGVGLCDDGSVCVQFHRNKTRPCKLHVVTHSLISSVLKLIILFSKL